MADGLLPVPRQPVGLLGDPYASPMDKAYGLLGADPTVDRGAILPVGTDAAGETVFAWPGMALDMVKNFLLPGHVVQGGAWSPQDVTEMAVDYGLLGTGASAARGLRGGREGIRGLLDPSTASMAGAKPRGVLDDAMRAVDDLPMDEASRMARAREMGFGLDVYHGALTPIQAIDPSVGERGVFHVTPDPQYASGYAGGAMTTGIARDNVALLGLEYGPNVMPLKLNPGQQLDLSGTMPMDEARALLAKSVPEREAGPIMAEWDQAARVAKAVGGGDGGVPLSDVWYALPNPAQTFAEQGYDTVRSGPGEIFVINPANIRSRFARFDPAKADSADLLASDLGGGLLGGALSLDRYLEDTDRQRKRAR